MSSPDLLDTLQQRLQSPLSDSQLESLSELIAADPKKYVAVMVEIRTQGIEIIPISLSPDDELDELVEWLTQLAATRNVGRGLNTVIASTAFILMVIAVGFGVTFFYSPTADEPAPLLEGSIDGVTTNPTDSTDPTDEESGSESENPSSNDLVDSRDATLAVVETTGLVLPELPVTPGWLAFDDPAARLDHSWVKSLSRYIRQPLEKPGILKPVELKGAIQYFDLEGDFLLPAPRDDGSSLRLRMSSIQNMVITAENDVQSIELTYDGHFNLKRYQPLPIHEFVRGLAIDSEPRFRRHFMESRVDPEIDFNWGLTGPVVNEQIVDPDYFAAQWKGFIIIPADGRYMFHVVADDGVKLRINGVQVMDSWVVQPELELSGVVDLTAGTYPIELDFFSDRMAARISLAWESEDLPKQVIPSDSLRSSAGPDGQPGLTGRYCYGPFVEAVALPVERAVDLVHNDNGRWSGLMRSGFDLRFQDNTFVIARGDIPLTFLPLDSAPTVLKIQTKARLQYLEPIRLEPLSGLKNPPIDEDRWQPASALPWYVLNDAPDSRGTYEIGEQGDVRLTRTEGSNPVHLQANIPIHGSTDIYAFMKNPTHLSGIRFQHPQNETFHSLYFVKMANSYVISMNPTDLPFTSDQYRAGFRFTHHVWWRAHYGNNQFVLSMSPDGEHWNVVHSFTLNSSLPRKREIVFGLTTLLGDEPAAVSLDKVFIKSDRLIEQLSTSLPIGSIPNVPLLKQATSNTQSVNALLSELETQRPETVSSEKWRLACYARAMETNMTPAMRQEALLRLFHHAVLYHPDTARVFEALVKIPQRLMMVSAEANLHSWQNLQNLYDLLAGRLWVENKPEKLKLLLDEWWMLSGGAGGRDRYNVNLPVAPELLTRLYLYHLRHLGRWQELYGFATKIQYLSLSQDGRSLFDKQFSSWRTARWLQGQAANALEQQQVQVKKPLDMERFLLARPSSVQTDRESVNAMREVLQAVEASDLDNAMTMITHNPIPEGLFPVDGMGIHFQSGRVYLRERLAQHAELIDKIIRDHSDLAALRLKKAVDAVDMNAVSQIAMRFPGTPASLEAIELLADRQLSTGLFLSAAHNYAELLELSADGNHDKWQAKRKLALALTGQKSPLGVETDVKLDGVDIPKVEFNALLDQLVAQRGRQYIKPVKQNLSPKNRSVVSLLDMSLPTAVRADTRRTRQVSFLDLGKNLLVHQPARLTCFSPGLKKIVWKIEDAGTGMPAEYMYCGQPIRFSDGVFTSVFKEKQFYWALINPVDGKLLWEIPAVGVPFADPIVVGPSVYVLTVTRQKTTFGQLSLQQLDSTAGEMVSSVPLLNVQIDAELFLSGRSALAQDQIVFTLAGVTYSTSLQGKLQWAQRLDQVPKLADERLHNQIVPTAPLVAGNKILVYTVGSPSLICLDRVTGTPLWRHHQPDLQKLVGVYDNHVLLVCQTGIQFLNLEDATISWFYPVSVNPQSVHLHNGHVLALMLDKPVATQPVSLARPRGLLWIHPQTGNVEFDFSLQEENALFFGAEQVFTFDDQIVVVSNVDINARTFKLLGLPVK
jgi:outer membrane protein assembly factor BamB